VAKKAPTTKTSPSKVSGGRKAPAKKAAPKAKTVAVSKPMTKAQIFSAIGERTGVAKKDVVAVMGELEALIEGHLSKKGPGQFTLPGLLKVARAKKPASKARMGRNPRTGEPMEIPARPARTTLRLRALKGLKAMIEPG
jgi:nucleoid DNA-binding protein